MWTNNSKLVKKKFNSKLQKSLTKDLIDLSKLIFDKINKDKIYFNFSTTLL